MSKTVDTLNSMVDMTVEYKSKIFTIKSWDILDGQIHFHTDSDIIKVNKSELDDVIDQMKVVNKTSLKKHSATQAELMNPTSLNPVDDILMDTIKKVQSNKDYVGQAKAINQSVNNLISAQKLKIEMLKQQRKINGGRD